MIRHQFEGKKNQQQLEELKQKMVNNSLRDEDKNHIRFKFVFKVKWLFRINQKSETIFETNNSFSYKKETTDLPDPTTRQCLLIL